MTVNIQLGAFPPRAAEPYADLLHTVFQTAFDDVSTAFNSIPGLSAGVLLAANNLTDLQDIAAAQNALDVYSRSASDNQYFFKAGRAGGATLVGGTGPDENLFIQSTADSNRGSIFLRDPTTVGTVADATLATGAIFGVQNVVVSDAIVDIANPTEVRQGTPLLVKLDHTYNYDMGTVLGLPLGPNTSLALRPADWSSFKKTHITVGSNGDPVATPASWATPNTLHVTSTTLFDSPSTPGWTGSARIRITMGGSVGGTVAVIQYTNVTSNTFTGCTFVSGSGTIATGATVQYGAVGTEAFPRGYVTSEGTTIFGHSAGLNAGAVGFIDLRVTRNPTGIARDIAGENVFLNNHTYMADGAVVNQVFGGFYPSLNTYGDVSFSAQPMLTTSATHGGQINNWHSVSFYSGPLHFENTHTAWRVGLYIDDADAAGNSFGDGLGIIDVAVGVQINPLITAAKNIAINVGNPDTTQTPLFRVQGNGQTFFYAGLFGGFTAGTPLYLAGTSNADKTTSQIVLDAPFVRIGFTPMTGGINQYTGGSGLLGGQVNNYGAITANTAITMNAPGGGSGTGNSYVLLGLGSVVSFAKAGNIFGSAVVADTATFKNTSTSTAISLGAIFSHFSSPTILADTYAIAANQTTFASAPIFGIVTGSGGSLTVGTSQALTSGLAVGAGAHVNARTALTVTDATGAGITLGTGTLDAQIGLFIDTLLFGGTLNIGILNKSSTLLGNASQLVVDILGNLSTSGTLTSSLFTQNDTTAAHGMVALLPLAASTQGIGGYDSSADLLPNWFIGRAAGVYPNVGVYLGNVGSVLADVHFSRTATSAAEILGQLTIATGLTFPAGKHITLATTGAGTQFGTSTSQKLAFFGKTAIIQPSGTPAAATDLASALTLVNFIRASVLQALGLTA